MPVLPPVAIASDAYTAIQNDGGGGLFEYGGALYVATDRWLTVAPFQHLWKTIYRSTDKGATWSLVASTGSFRYGYQRLHYDAAAGIIYWAGQYGGAFQFHFMSFNLNTGAFSSVTDTPVITMWGFYYYFRMSDGKHVVITWNAAGGMNYRWQWWVYDGAAWTTHNVGGLGVAAPGSHAMIDPNGIIHLFYRDSNDGLPYYTQINGVAGTNTVPVAGPAAWSTWITEWHKFGIGPDSPVVIGNSMYFVVGTTTGFTTVKIDDYTNPAPTITTTVAAYPHTECASAPGQECYALLNVGSKLYIVWLDGATNISYTWSTNEGITWATKTVAYSSFSGPYVGLHRRILSNGELGVLTYLGPVVFYANFLSFTFLPTTPSPVGYRGGKPYLKCGNVWDWCLKNSECPWYLVPWAEHGCIPVKCWRLEDDPLHSIPEQGRELHKSGSIPLPAAPSVDTQILSFRVPLGYDGILYSVLCKYVGPAGYVNGSGDLIWRFRQNEKWIKSLHSIPTEMGDFTTYMQLDEYIRLYSGQTVRAYGWLSPTAGMKGGSLVAAVQGWYFPSQFAR